MRPLHKMGIYVTQKAWNKMEEIIQASNNLGFLFQATSGGCNGFNFKLDTLDKKTFNNMKNPTLIQNNKVKLYIDPKSEMFLLGTVIDHVTEDYLKGQYESKFLFQVDPKLASSCGCGISFSPKI